MTPDVRPLITKLTLARRRRFRFAKLQLPLRLRRLLSRLNAPIKPRFSLRNFFIFTTLVICFFGWVAKERSQSKFERQLGAKLQEQGNRVRFLGLYHSLELSKRFMPQGEWRDLARQFLGERISTITYAGYLENLKLLAGLTNLEELNFKGTSVSDQTLLTGLAELTNLKSLTISSTLVSDLTPLAGLTNLEQLELFCYSASDLTPLAGLTNLKSLTISGTFVSDLTPLAGLKDLEYLWLSGTSATDVTPLAGLKKLKMLGLNRSSVSNLSPLAGLKNLKNLHVRGTSLIDEQIKSLQLALPNCIVNR